VPDGNNSSPPRNDGKIPDTEALYRRVHFERMIYDENLQRQRSSSAAWDDITGEISVYLGSALAAEALPPACVLDDHPGYRLFVVTAGEARTLGFGVVSDPDPDENHPRAKCHGLLTGLLSGNPGRRQRKRLASASQLVAA
jgi:hypothetical protein